MFLLCYALPVMKNTVMNNHIYTGYSLMTPSCSLLHFSINRAVLDEGCVALNLNSVDYHLCTAYCILPFFFSINADNERNSKTINDLANGAC